MFEQIAGAVIVAILGGLGASSLGAYKATKNGGETFDSKKFVTFIPKSLVGAVVALGLAVVGGQVTDFNIASPLGFFTIFLTGFGTTLGLSGLKSKPVENPQ